MKRSGWPSSPGCLYAWTSFVGLLPATGAQRTHLAGGPLDRATTQFYTLQPTVQFGANPVATSALDAWQPFSAGPGNGSREGRSLPPQRGAGWQPPSLRGARRAAAARCSHSAAAGP